MTQQGGEPRIYGGGRDFDGEWQRVLGHIRQALEGLTFGEVTIVVQDGVVVQIERLEKKRLR